MQRIMQQLSVRLRKIRNKLVRFCGSSCPVDDFRFTSSWHCVSVSYFKISQGFYNVFYVKQLFLAKDYVFCWSTILYALAL